MKSESIFYLIKNMSKEEKRFFKLYSSITNSEKYYVLLFEEFDYAKTFKKDMVKQFAQKHNLPQEGNRISNYLSKTLIDCLTIFDRKNNTHYYLQKALALYNRNLYTEALHIIQKGKQKSYEQELSFLLLDLISLEIVIMLKKNSIDNDEQVTQTSLEQRNIAEQCFNQTTANYINQKGTEVVRKYQNTLISPEELQDELKSLLTSPLLQASISDVPYKTLSLLNNFKMLVNPIMPYFDNNALITEALLLFKNKMYNQTDQVRLAFIHNIIIFCINIKFLEKYNESLELLHKMPLLDDTMIVSKQYIYFHCALSGSCAFELYTLNSQQLTEIKNLIDNDKTVYDRKRILLIKFMAQYYFGSKNFSSCIDYLQQIFELKVDVNDFIYFDSQLMYAISHLELGNTFITKNIIENFSRRLQRNEVLLSYQKKILSAFKALYSSPITMKNLQSFYNQISPILSQTYSLNYLDNWIKSKISLRAKPL